MAMTLQEIGALLTEAEIKHEIVKRSEREIIAYVYSLKEYVDGEDGSKKAKFFISLEEDGEYIKIIAPKLYIYKEGPYKEAVLQALLQICWKTKLVEYEYDASDGEVRLIIEFPLEDGKLTKKQLERCIRGMVGIIEDYHQVIDTVMRTGVINFDLEKNKAGDLGSMTDLLREFQAYLEAKKAGQVAAEPPTPVGLEE